ncbi:hypothetical protein AB0K16_22125 [Nonomuraea jabiensis]|uniref:hypothetical protein n=1 Tax=Nonomuraea jabiensis TaxID=882448 RepID=UPI003430FD28
MNPNDDLGVSTPLYLVTVTYNDTDSWGVAIRFDRAQTIRELRETIYKEYPHGKFRDQALDAKDLLTHYRNEGSPKLGDVWWISCDHLLWITDGVRYQIHEMDANAPMVVIKK